jgi:hypothetical protein
MRTLCGLCVIMISLGSGAVAWAQETVVVRPKESDEVLTNPGIGFMTFQRFNGDQLNPGKRWTEGYPIVYQEPNNIAAKVNYPLTSLAYFRIYWRFIEPAEGEYRWDLIDKALETAGIHNQTLLLRIAPYGTGPDNDVPDWYRAMLGEEKNLPEGKWRTNPEDPRYVEHFGRMVRDLGARYDGHPMLESVDLAIVGAWGEGAGSELLTQKTREALVDSYLAAFHQTPLVMLLTDPKTNRYGLSQRPVGWRVDCLGDMGGFSPTWCHMLDYYPQAIIECGMQDAWRKAPVTLEVCWVMQHWLDQGWDIDYIIDQSLKWHISSFNAKSSPVPDAWWPQVNRWLKHMGYRFVLRKFTYRTPARAGGPLAFTSWWENQGVAPCYRPFRLALRLGNADGSWLLVTAADLRTWLPGDNLYDASVTIPAETPPGDYDLCLAILGDREDEPKVRLAIQGRRPDGWYDLGKIKVLSP